MSHLLLTLAPRSPLSMLLCVTKVESAEKKEKAKVTYHKYTPTQRADNIGKYAAHHGASAACKHFKPLLGHDVPEPTARKFKNAYVNELERRKQEVPTDQCIAPVHELPPKKRGRPLLLGQYDELVQDYIKCLRKAGGVVNTSIAVAVAEGLLLSRNRSMLVQFGGIIRLDKP